MFTISSLIGDFFLDPTALQYGRTQKDDQTWTRLEDDILKNVEEELVDLRADIDRIVHGSHSDVWRSRAFHTLLEDSEGAGNDCLVKYLSRAHGAALSP